MPMYLCQEEMIAFDSPGAGRKQPGVRFDVDFDGMVAVDASAYPKLDADDCRTLAGWLLRQADRMSQHGKSVWYMTDPWTLINCETQEPVLAMDAAGFPSLVFSSRRDAEESARAHAELWGIECYPARLRVAG